MHLWRVDDGEPLSTLVVERYREPSVAVSPEDASVSYGTREMGSVVLSLAFSPDGRTLAVTSERGGLRYFSLPDGRLLLVARGIAGADAGSVSTLRVLRSSSAPSPTAPRSGSSAASGLWPFPSSSARSASACPGCSRGPSPGTSRTASRNDGAPPRSRCPVRAAARAPGVAIPGSTGMRGDGMARRSAQKD
ncbi:MAG: hypothetical protein MZU84_00855 [Sphingobacterium sp.]|nr:hypothetical protein [Sphingobacterium sp.]